MKERKLNNKGFSLVELIIVIAIMVILVVVFAPQYLRFVNNSRISTDVQTASSMATALDAAVAEGRNPFPAGGTINNTTNAAIAELVPLPATKLNGGEWTITGDNTTGTTRITLTTAAGTFECYPDPESRTNHGINNMSNDADANARGLRQ